MNPSQEPWPNPLLTPITLHLEDGLRRGSTVSTSNVTPARPAPTGSDTILQRSLVEDVGWEVGKGGVHAVLHLQTDGADTQHHQTLKQRLGQTGTCRLLAHHHRSQLAMVTHKDQLATHMDTGNKTLIK